MSRTRSLARLIGLAIFDIAAYLGLSAAGRVERWAVDWSHLSRWFDVTPPADVMVGLLRWAALVGVLYIAATTALYMLAAMTRVPRLMRAAGLFTVPGVRRLVEGSVAVGMLATTTFSRMGPALAQAPSAGYVERSAVVATASPAVVDGAYPAAVAPSATEAGSRVTEPGDCYWTMAADALAHELAVGVDSLTDDQIAPYWLDMIAASTDGNSSGDPNLIFPGEVQVLPIVAGSVDVAIAVPADPETTAPAPEAPVERPAEQAPVDAPADVPAATPVVAPPAEPVSGTPLEGVPDTAPVEDVGAVADAPYVAEVPVTDPAVTTTAAATTSQPPYGLAGMGLLAAVLLEETVRRRRGPDRRRRAGEVVTPPPPAAAAVEVVATVAADPIGVEFLRLALRAFAGAVLAVPEGDELPTPLGLVLSDTALDVVLVEPVAVPAGCAPAITGRENRWRFDRHASSLAMLTELGEGCPSPMPALVSLGRTAAGADVILDLEEAAMVAVSGPGAGELVVAAGLQLGLPAWDGMAAVVLVGVEGAPSLPNIRVVASLADILPELEARAERTATLVREAGCGSAFEARVMADNAVEEDGQSRALIPDTEPLIPTIIVCPTTPPRRLVDRLVGLVNSPSVLGVAAIIAGEVEGVPWQYRISGDSLHVTQLGIDVDDLAGVGPGEYRAIVDLLDSAEAEPLPAPPVTDVAPMPAVSGRPTILVRVLGPIGVEGPDGPITVARSGKCIEALVAMTVFRNRPIDKDRMVTWLWPRSESAAKSGDTLDSHMYHLRQAVGRDFLPPGGYVVTDEVATDEALLRDALARARVLEPDEALAALWLELDNVRGLPYDHATKGYEFTAQLARDAGQLVINAAHRAFELALAAGDLDRAWEATAKGLLAVPGSEQMYRDRGLIHQARGDGRDAVQRTLDEVMSYADDDDPTALDESTVRLFAELTAVA